MNNADETVQKCDEILDRLYERSVKQFFEIISNEIKKNCT